MSRARKSDAELVIEYFGTAPVEEAALVLRLGKAALQRRMDRPARVDGQAAAAAPRRRQLKPKVSANATAPTAIGERASLV